MMKMNLQLFAHKKGVGSTKNGRDSESIGYQESHRTYFFVLFLFPFLCSSCNITLIISTVKR